MKQITPQQLADWLQDTARPAPVLLDVREPSEFSYCAIPGSLPMPMASVPWRRRRVDRICFMVRPSSRPLRPAWRQWAPRAMNGF